MLPIRQLLVPSFVGRKDLQRVPSAIFVGFDTALRIEKRFRERGNFALGGIDDVNVDNVRAILTSRL